MNAVTLPIVICAVAFAAGSAWVSAPAVGQTSDFTGYIAPGEFEPQGYIWLSWFEHGWLGVAGQGVVPYAAGVIRNGTRA